MNLKSNEPKELAEYILKNTDINLFLTGKAGTGKTTFLKQLKESSLKRIAITAPTGVAAINAGGVTLHSFFQLNFGPYIPGSNIRDKVFSFRKEKLNIIRGLDLLVIDEISMVRADLLDYVDAVLRQVRRTEEPFGGLQLLMIGDLQQLAPVVKDDEWINLSKFYDSPFFFSSLALQRTDYACVELKTIYRQQDPDFVEILNTIRENKINPNVMEKLNSRYVPNFEPSEKDGYICLTTHNAKAQTINNQKLTSLKTKALIYKAAVEGNFPELSYPTDFDLKLKVGAQVMFIKNDSSYEHRYYNGKIGHVVALNKNSVEVICGNEIIIVEPEKWENRKYIINEETKEMEEYIDGSFTQIPLKTAWAITVHKSQGLTFDRAIIDAQDSFSHGQVYVALSRCRTLDGLVLLSPITETTLIKDNRLDHFNQSIKQKQPTFESLDPLRCAYYRKLLTEQFSFRKLNSALISILRLAELHLVRSNPEICDFLKNTAPIVQKEVIDVSEKFLIQISNILNQNPEPEGNSFLSERIQKGAEYFKDKCEVVLDQIAKVGLRITTNNQKIDKDINIAFDYYTDMLNEKKETLKACLDGFSTDKYLRAKSISLIQETKVADARRKADEEKGKALQTEVHNKQLYELLRKWRMNMAEKGSKPAFVICTNEALATIADYVPINKKEMEEVRGFGKKKIETYGDEILCIIKKYIVENKTIDAYRDNKKKKKKEKENRVSTAALTLQLFNQGKTIEEIAKERSLVASTVEGHLFKMVSKGLLALDKISKRSKIEKIKKLIREKGITENKDLKEILGSQYSWAEIRFAQEEYEQESNT